MTKKLLNSLKQNSKLSSFDSDTNPTSDLQANSQQAQIITTEQMGSKSRCEQQKVLPSDLTPLALMRTKSKEIEFRRDIPDLGM